ncbi:MAG: hypothetical protein GY731_14280, partial [Gammaproteobacteria bacterium]|nr:hypothetical protein [Gammaproteobacteria bacterium]
MNFFTNLKLKQKLGLTFLMAGILPAAVVAIISLIEADNSLRKATVNQLEAVRGIKQSQIESYFRERQGDMGVLMETVSAMQSSAFAKLEAVQELKKRQLEEFFQGQRQRLQALKSDPYAQTAMFRFIQDFDEEEKIGTSTWNRLAAKYQTRFEELMNQYGWYDIFIIHPNGDILYSVTRESDLGMNLADSELKDSALGRAYAEAVDMDAESLAVGDFAPYAPSNGAFAAFMMAKI